MPQGAAKRGKGIRPQHGTKKENSKLRPKKAITKAKKNKPAAQKNLTAVQLLQKQLTSSISRSIEETILEKALHNQTRMKLLKPDPAMQKQKPKSKADKEKEKDKKKK